MNWAWSWGAFPGCWCCWDSEEPLQVKTKRLWNGLPPKCTELCKIVPSDWVSRCFKVTSLLTPSSQEEGQSAHLLEQVAFKKRDNVMFLRLWCVIFMAQREREREGKRDIPKMPLRLRCTSFYLQNGTAVCVCFAKIVSFHCNCIVLHLHFSIVYVYALQINARGFMASESLSWAFEAIMRILAIKP